MVTNSRDLRETRRGVPDPTQGPTLSSRAISWWYSHGRLRSGIAVAVVVLVLAPMVLGAWRAPGAPMEEGKLLIAGELVLDGKVPHDDFEHFYGPADVWAVATSMAVFGRNLGAERLLGVGYFMLFVGSIFVLTRRFGLTAAALAAITAGVIGVPFGVHAYSWSAGVALGLAAIALALAAMGPSGDDREGTPFLARTDHAQTRAATISGGLAGLALLYRPDLILAIGAALLVLAPRLRPDLRRRGFLAATATCLVPYLVHLAMAGPGPTFDGIITSTLFRLRDGRSLPVPPPGNELTAWLDLSAPDPPPSRVLPDIRLVVQLQAFFWLTAAATVVLLIVAWYSLRRHRAHPLTPALASVSLFSALLVTQMLQRADATHVRFAASTILAVAPVMAAVALHLLDRRFPRDWGAVQFLLMSGFAVALLVPYYTLRLASVDLRWGVGARSVAVATNDGRRFPVIDPIFDDVTGVIDLVDREGPGSGRIFIGPQELRLANYADSFLYHLLSDYTPASFFLESNPGIANRPGSRLADDLRRADVLVLSDEYDNWDEPNASRVFGPDEPNQVVKENFCLAGTSGRYEVHFRLGTAAAERSCQ